MDRDLFKKQKRFNTLLVTLGFFVIYLIFFYTSNISYAQTYTDNGQIQISAFVPGCGDNLVQTPLGEQCEGPNTIVKKLNGQSCRSLGFETGILGCRDTCIFDTSLCTGTSTGGGSTGGSGSLYSKPRGSFTLQPAYTKPIVSNTNLIFSGTAGPGDVIVILNGSTYFASGIASSDGTFSIVISDFEGDIYNFNFYSISQVFGKSNILKYKAAVKENTTTQITNINLEYTKKPIVEKIVELVGVKGKPLFDVLMVNVIEPETPVLPFLFVLSAGAGLVLLLKIFASLFKLLSSGYINTYEK